MVLRARSGTTQVALRRYASSAAFPVFLGALAPGQPVFLEIPPDRSTEPWEVELAGTGAIDVCQPSSV
jgi:hypothetical protein